MVFTKWTDEGLEREEGEALIMNGSGYYYLPCLPQVDLQFPMNQHPSGPAQR